MAVGEDDFVFPPTGGAPNFTRGDYTIDEGLERALVDYVARRKEGVSE